MLPIIPGCLATVINSHDTGDNGKTVTVGKYLGKVSETMLQDDMWETDVPMVVLDYITRKPIREEHYQSERRLMRIDGGKFKEHIEDFIQRLGNETFDKAKSAICVTGNGAKKHESFRAK